MNKILILLTLVSLSVNADPVEDVWDWANDNPIATAAIVVGEALENSAIVSGVTVAIVSPTAAPATSSTAVGASISAANATGKAKYAAAIGPTVTPPPTTIAAVAIGLSFAIGASTRYAGTMLTEAESEAQRAAYLEHVAMNKNMASEITKLLSNPLH
jgi:hypothetical protein